MNNRFKALRVTEVSENEFSPSIVERTIDDLPEGDLLIQVHYSSLNYKDALSFNGNKGVTRNYPHTPGIDAAGTVVTSENPDFKVGDEVLVTGFDLGMNTDGGFAEYIRIPSEWAISLPDTLSLKESMIYGTAGFTAALSVDKLLQADLSPADGEILVTGASGGVGSIAITILNELGFDVVAATGKTDKEDHLINLGAKRIIDREEIAKPTKRALLSSDWAGVVDTLGGDVLSNSIKATKYGGSVTSCGNVLSGNLHTSIYPFILRGISLLGIDSVNTDRETRQRIWNSLATDWKAENLEDMIQVIKLSDLAATIEQMLAGEQVGRSLVQIQS